MGAAGGGRQGVLGGGGIGGGGIGGGGGGADALNQMKQWADSQYAAGQQTLGERKAATGTGTGTGVGAGAAAGRSAKAEHIVPKRRALTGDLGPTCDDESTTATVAVPPSVSAMAAMAASQKSAGPPSPPPSPPGYRPPAQAGTSSRTQRSTQRGFDETQWGSPSPNSRRAKPTARDPFRRLGGGGAGTTTRRAGGAATTTRRGATDELEEEESFEVDESVGERVQPSVQDTVSARLGESNGRVRRAEELHASVHALGERLATKMPLYSGAFLAELGNVMLALMEPAARVFAIELLLPWTRNLALVDPKESSQLERDLAADLEGVGYCVVEPSKCLPRVFAYTLEMSAEGLPEVLARFWRQLALAAPPYKEGAPPHNVPVLASWIGRQAVGARDERDKQTCRSLELYVKGLGVRTRDDLEEERAKIRHAAAIERHQRASVAAAKIGDPAPPPPPPLQPGIPHDAKRAKVIAQMQQISKQCREKSTRSELLEAEIERGRRLEANAMEQQNRADERRRRFKSVISGVQTRIAAEGVSSFSDKAPTSPELEPVSGAVHAGSEDRVGARRTPLPTTIPQLPLAAVANRSMRRASQQPSESAVSHLASHASSQKEKDGS